MTKSRNVGKIIRMIALLVFSAVFIIALVKLVSIQAEYKKAQDLYQNVQDQYVAENKGESGVNGAGAGEESVSGGVDLNADDVPESTDSDNPNRIVHSIKQYSQASAPIAVDFDGLLKVNADTIGWLYVEGIPSVSYPLVQTVDDDYYLHHTFDRQESKSGTVFVSCQASADLTSPHTLIFGHNMHDGTMFSSLDTFKTAGFAKDHPYFWILTPEGDYKYKIVSVFDVNRVSNAFGVFSEADATFEEWLGITMERSLFDLGEEVSAEDYMVTLVTCVPDSYNRTCIVAKLVKEIEK